LINSKESISNLIKIKGREIGFDYIGFSKAEMLENEESRLDEWLHAGYHGDMTYLKEHFSKRLDPSELVKGTKSIISLLYNYYPDKELNGDNYKIAKYAYGKDYHKIIKKRLKTLTSYLEEISPDVKFRVFVDSAPVMERQWAEKSGLGWIGKNTLLINKNKGSFFFIAEILADVELDYDKPIKDYCGACTKCLDACPTDAFPEPYVLNASKCISYATIELKENHIPELFKGKMEDWIFGCDICQDVCPWNRFSSPNMEEYFNLGEPLISMDKEKWHNLNEEDFDELFYGSSVKRSKYSGLKRNINFVRTD